jgi:post-segregation antitoxin (ccd killing protein)
MPRPGTRLSPEAAENQRAAERRWHLENYENLSLPLRKGKRDAYKRLAAARGLSVSAMIQTYMDDEYERQLGSRPE